MTSSMHLGSGSKPALPENIHLQGENKDGLAQGKVRVMLGNQEIDVIEIKLGGKGVDLSSLQDGGLESLATRVQELYSEQIGAFRKALESDQAGDHRITLQTVVAKVKESTVTEVKVHDQEYKKDSGQDNPIITTAQNILDLLKKQPSLLSGDVVARLANLERQVAALTAAGNGSISANQLGRIAEAAGLQFGAGLDEIVEAVKELKRGLEVSKDSLRGVQGQVANFERQINENRTKIFQLEGEITSLKADGAVSAASIREKDAEIARLQGENQRLSADLDAAQAQVAKLEEPLRELYQKLGGASEETTIKDVIAGLKAALEAKLSELEQAKQEISQLKTQLDAKGREVAGLTEANRGLQEQVTSLTSQLANATSCLRVLQAASEASDEKLVDHRGQLKTIISGLEVGIPADFDFQTAPLEAIRSLLEGGIAKLTGDKSRLEGELATVQAKLHTSASALEAAKAETDRFREALDGATAQVASLTLKNAELQATSEALTSANSKLSKQLDQRDATIAEQQAAAKAAAATAATQISSLTSKSTDLQSHVAQLKEQLAAAEASNADLTAALAALTASSGAAATAAAAALSGVQVQNQDLSGRVRDLSSQLKKIEAERDEALAAAAASRAEVDQLTSQLAQRIIPVHVTLPSESSEPSQFDHEGLSQLLDDLERARSVSVRGSDQSKIIADKLAAIIESIPPQVFLADVRALTDESEANIELYANVLNILAEHPEIVDAKVAGLSDENYRIGNGKLILNLMLVVANQKPELVLESSECKSLLAKALKGNEVRAHQIAAALSDKPGFLNSNITALALPQSTREATSSPEVFPVSITLNASFLSQTQEKISKLDVVLNRGKVLSQEHRDLVKQQACTAIKDYLNELEFQISDEGVEALAQYVRKEGRLPDGIQKYLSAKIDDEKTYQEPLAQMLYIYTACSSKYEERFKSIASLEQLRWLTERGKSGPNHVSTVLLSFIKGANGKAFTHEQAIWGKQVHTLIQGGSPDPITAQGGAGKTVTVQHFMRLLSETSSAKNKMIFLSPIGQERKVGDDGKITSKKLPRADGGGNIVIDVIGMSRDDMEKARLVIDEAHIIRPEMKVFLYNGSDKVEVKTWLKLTASPLTMGYDLTEAVQTSLAAARSDLAALDLAARAEGIDEAKIADQERVLAVAEMFAKHGAKLRAAAFATGVPLKTQIDFNAVNSALKKPNVTYQDLVDKGLQNLIGGAIATRDRGDGVGLLGNLFCIKSINWTFDKKPIQRYLTNVKSLF